eukprot:CAMPEP_0114576112 /NCGR_PEP_ID=MMETSP0125-20121206/900_1 /TAXON_ID=485358 ORGANISM="Aristerostoma sp., Strain ATCC 50986" /NCGR_SAMPLE_ID=MMETSP0125 /ASSEMBLY_ACC=CAM_ASM_000245 /LENGTH=206 /DNA_ID=CAMNT_0001764353 /DNA_START=499 /DNA_END=1119 /DNA_ORIENTATION=-
MKNHVEKLLLHFLSLNYDSENLPYSELTLTEFLKKYLPYSVRRDVMYFLNFENKPLDEIANDMLYAELCKEVSDPNVNPKDKDELTVLESRILKDLTMNNEIIKNELNELTEHKEKLEESILKLESASTEAQTNKMNNQIMKFSLNNEYERFLNDMNNKLETLVGASDELMFGLKHITNMVGHMPKNEEHAGLEKLLEETKNKVTK